MTMNDLFYGCDLAEGLVIWKLLFSSVAYFQFSGHALHIGFKWLNVEKMCLTFFFVVFSVMLALHHLLVSLTQLVLCKQNKCVGKAHQHNT